MLCYVVKRTATHKTLNIHETLTVQAWNSPWTWRCFVYWLSEWSSPYSLCCACNTYGNKYYYYYIIIVINMCTSRRSLRSLRLIATPLVAFFLLAIRERNSPYPLMPSAHADRGGIFHTSAAGRRGIGTIQRKCIRPRLERTTIYIMPSAESRTSQ